MDLYIYSHKPWFLRTFSDYIKHKYKYPYSPHVITDTPGAATRLKGIREAMLFILDGKISTELDKEIQERAGRLHIVTVTEEELLAFQNLSS